MKSKDWKVWVIGIIVTAMAFLILSCQEASAQEVVLQPGESVTLTVTAAVVPSVHDTTFVTVTDTLYVPVEVPGPTVTVYDCPPDYTTTIDGDAWTCTPPVVVIVTDTIPPLSVSGLVLSIVGDSLVVTWNNRPNPDRGGVGVTGYVVRGGSNTSNLRLPTATVDGTPHKWKLTIGDRYWVCVAAKNDAGEAESSCRSITYTEAIAVLNMNIPQPQPMQDGLMAQVNFLLDDVRAVSDYVATLNGTSGVVQPGEWGWYWYPAPATGTITVSGQGQTWTGSY